VPSLRRSTVAADRLVELVSPIRTAVIQSVMVHMVDDAEEKLRTRLSRCRTAWFYPDYLEPTATPNKLYTVDLVATKILGTASPRLLGIFAAGTRLRELLARCLAGGVAGAVIPTLGFGIPWNDGLLNPVEIIARDGLICSAVAPSPRR